MKLDNKYVIGTNVMWFEIEMYEDFIKGLVNLLNTDIENKENVIIDLCLNLSQHLEKLDTDKIPKMKSLKSSTRVEKKYYNLGMK